MSAHNELWADMNVLAQIVVVAVNVVLLVPTITVGWLLGDTTLPQPKHVPMPPPLVLAAVITTARNQVTVLLAP